MFYLEPNFVPTTLKFLIKSEPKIKLTEAKRIIKAIIQGFVYLQGKEKLQVPGYVLELAAILGVKQKAAKTKSGH